MTLLPSPGRSLRPGRVVDPVPDGRVMELFVGPNFGESRTLERPTPNLAPVRYSE